MEDEDEFVDDDFEEEECVDEEFNDEEFVDEEFLKKECVDEESQEEEYVNEEFHHEEDVGVPFQWFEELNYPPTYDTEAVNEDLVISSLSCDQDEEFEVEWIPSLMYNIYPEKRTLPLI